MARSSKAETGALFNPVSLGLLALALLVLDVVVNPVITSAVETFLIDFSGVLFGLALGYTIIGKKRHNHSLAVFTLVVYVLCALVLYLLKYINA